MKESSERTCIVELHPEELVIVSRLEPNKLVTTIKVYERKHFFINPNPLVNQVQIEEYLICPSCFSQAINDITEMYTGWSKIDTTLPTKLIGIHNQDRNTLYIQFSLGQRYFIYERCLKQRKETVSEELFGKKHNFRLRALSHEDERFLISKLRFTPKVKKAISFYPLKNHYALTRRHQLLPYSG
ncbi:MAG: hypothetical protein Q8912_10770 [Bacillota bacterium]|nr:hypothetical protein [Bacillota bacterium]